MRQNLLMCAPKYFGVEYVINPWMKHHLGDVSMYLASQQWLALYLAIKGLANVKLIEPQPEVPDMVFTANAGLLRGKTILLSRFRHGERRREEPYFKAWFEANAYQVVDMPGDIRFEGAGDALFQPECDLLWAAHGFRSDQAGHGFLAELFKVNTISLRLIDSRFYHLDTCFCPLPGNMVMYYPGAFDAESVRKIEANSKACILISEEDALSFACNAVQVDNKIVMNNASAGLRSQLERAGFDVLTVSVSEFIKAGGANKCLTFVLDEPAPGGLGCKTAA